jgi:hypothetical protein
MDVISVTLDLRAGLAAVHAAAKSLPSNWILFSQCLFCATLADDFQGMYILHYWMAFLAGFGGGVSSSLLIMVGAMCTVVVNLQQSAYASILAHCNGLYV